MSFTFPRLWTLAPRRGGILAVALVVLGVLVGLSVAGAASVGPVQNVSRDNAGSIGPQVAQDPDGNIHVVWISDESNTRVVRYAKGTWNGSTYNIGGSSVLAEVGSFGYASPTVAVAPNGILMAAWSDGTVHMRSWNSRDNQPGGGTVDLGEGIEPSIAPDSSNRFHIAWNGNFQVQYCQWAGGGCQARDAWSSEEQGSSRPDIAVDSNNGVHVVWGGLGQIARYRARAANAGWGSIQDISGGTSPQIAADGQGNVHIVWSQNFDIQYCRRTLGTGCADQRTFSADDDLSPSIGATQGGRLVVVFRDAASRTLWYAAREDGNWGGAQRVAAGPTAADATPRSYTDRISFVWSLDFDIQLATVTPQPVTVPATPTASPTGTPRPTATPTPTPLPNAPATGAFDIANNDFRNVWTRTDLLVLQNAVTHSWIWGPAPFTQSVSEEYVQSPGGQRQVQYFDKSRMEINQPNAPRGQYYVTNGRLADELITGLLQFGDAQYRQREP
ncbi:MAG: hypothetical protein M3380_06060, partial [Chloroflexota bacterium]|nr:hypothetical protein [Chloroflexota bacterium]